MASSRASPGCSPDSDVSPMSVAPSKQAEAKSKVNGDYFSPAAASKSQGHDGCEDGGGTGANGESEQPSTQPSAQPSTQRRHSSISFPVELPKPDHSTASDEASNSSTGRKGSTSSISFQCPRNPSLPQGNQRQTTGPRIRASSPPYRR